MTDELIYKLLKIIYAYGNHVLPQLPKYIHKQVHIQKDLKWT